MDALAETLFTEEEEPQKRRFQKEREDALHRERRPDDAARVVRETRPIGAELKLHRDSSDDAKEEIDGEYFGPEARRAVVALVPFPQSERLEDHDERREPHRELGEDIVVGYGEGEMQPINGAPLLCYFHHPDGECVAIGAVDRQ